MEIMTLDVAQKRIRQFTLNQEVFTQNLLQNEFFFLNLKNSIFQGHE